MLLYYVQFRAQRSEGSQHRPICKYLSLQQKHPKFYRCPLNVVDQVHLLISLNGGWRQGFREVLGVEVVWEWRIILHSSFSKPPSVSMVTGSTLYWWHTPCGTRRSLFNRGKFSSDWTCKSLVALVCRQEVCKCVCGTIRRGVERDKVWGRPVYGFSGSHYSDCKGEKKKLLICRRLYLI